jgi:thymidine phosphorylase
VTEGQPLFTLLSDDEHRFARALESLDGGYDIGAEGTAYDPTPLVIDRIS